jgi:hypothetical protein
MSEQRLGRCGHPITTRSAKIYCSLSCAMKAARARQSPERKREIALLGRAAQRNDEWERFKARLRVMANTEEERWMLAFRYGLQCKYVRRYRRRKAAAEGVA